MQINTIFIAEDHQLVREAWKLTIEKESNFKIIGEADSCEATLEFCLQNKVDVILMDINLKDGNSISTIKIMFDRIPNVNIVVISMLNVLAIIKDLYKHGVKAYLTKNSSKEQLLIALNKAANNNVYFSPEISQLLLDFDNELIHTLNSKEIKIYHARLNYKKSRYLYKKNDKINSIKNALLSLKNGSLKIKIFSLITIVQNFLKNK